MNIEIIEKSIGWTGNQEYSFLTNFFQMTENDVLIDEYQMQTCHKDTNHAVCNFNIDICNYITK